MHDHDHENEDDIHGNGHGHSHGTHHHGDHHHTWTPPSHLEAKVLALESLLVERGLTSHEAIDAVVSAFENDLGPMHGARVVAKAWTDPDFAARLKEDGTKAVLELGYKGLFIEHLQVLFNEPGVHHVWCCTLCSCYPWRLLGVPPVWFKSTPYRSRIVNQPRQVLREFGLELDPDVRIHVWDSSAEVRYLVVPERPAGTEGMNEDELVKLITRDSMIGTGLPLSVDRNMS